MLLRTTESAGRGRALVAATRLAGGQVVLHESPLLIYAEAEAAASRRFCSECARCVVAPCPACEVCGCVFCGAVACASSHTPWLCSALARVIALGMNHEAETQARFLVASTALASTDPAAFQRLLLLDGGEQQYREQDQQDYIKVASAVQSILHSSSPGEPSLSLELMIKLLGKDKGNAFGLMAPTCKGGERKVRAYALYAQASLFNHDCLPNACRFEYLDKEGADNRDIYIRLLHDVEEGTEICLSYFPVNWSRDERQQRLLEDYGFQCTCNRCNVEAAWQEDMDADNDDEEDHEDVEQAEDDFPHAIFFVKYLCPDEECGGTMAPLTHDPSTMECNACGLVRTEQAFLQELEQQHAAQNDFDSFEVKSLRPTKIWKESSE